MENGHDRDGLGNDENYFKVSTVFYQVENGHDRDGLGNDENYFWKTKKETEEKEEPRKPFEPEDKSVNINIEPELG